ncbi:hypothetical protein PPSIR1_25136 [Plesiocystis pacifica SIR-1]|uniref:Uncharacterized protein n=1 Tax=Plesiocystis pacifica SIR-1 TaxID=391625 RepID=A6GDX5_9BACT|nr:hypothetical protein PPSIR1_25136 [Plesiocystis pacifica SIR-1]
MSGASLEARVRGVEAFAELLDGLIAQALMAG